ncbi:ArnT family glycosyltransferase [Paenibacillus mesotrionivorans]|uniref:ArnT family glycosyltransferase n=1 Tax=Paenibacillus mesotrionivorans TaxID=3160968 RepID=A0ACC7NX95_9BACL
MSRKYWMAFSFILIFIYLLLSLYDSNINYLILASAIFLFGITQCLMKTDMKMIIIFLLLIASVYFIFIPSFSPVDEDAHFDYIMHIVRHRDIPTLFDKIDLDYISQTSNLINAPTGTIQYEAVHPPLYYLMAAVIALFSSHVTVSFYMIRMLGLICFGLTIYLIIKSYKELVEQKVVSENAPLFYGILILFFMSPGIITRMITISNEHLAVLLCTGIFAFWIKFHFNKRFVHLISFSVLTGMVIITKLTTIFIAAVILLYLLTMDTALKKKVKMMVIFSTICILILAPWILFNLHQYHAFTATKLHVEFVRGLLPSQDLNLGSILQYTTDFLMTYWSPQEVIPRKDPFLFFALTLVVFFFWVLMYAFSKCFSGIQDIIYGKSLSIQTFFSIVFLCNIAMLVLGTYSTNISVMIGRYLYISILPIVFLTYLFITKVVLIQYQRLVLAILLIFICLLSSYNIHTLLNSSNNIPDKIITAHLKDSISSKNFSDPKFKRMLDVHNLNNIPYNLGEKSISFINFEGMKNLISNSADLKLNSLTVNKNNDRGINFLVNNQDPHFTFEIPQHTTSMYDYLLITFTKLQENQIAKGQLFWNNGSGFTEEMSLLFDVSIEGVYILPMGQISGWVNSKFINEIRLDIENVSEFSIDRISLEK